MTMNLVGLRATPREVARHRDAGTWRTISIVDDMFRWAAREPNSTMLFADSEKAGLKAFTYQEMSDHSSRLAVRLAHLGVGPGTLVSAQLPNCWQAIALALATWRRGAVWAPIMTTIAERERHRMLAGLEPQVFIGATPSRGAAVHDVVVDPRREEWADDSDFGLAPTVGGVERVVIGDEPIDPDSVALVLFTSGTTGAPKAALKTLNNVYATVLPLLDEEDGGRRRSIYTPQTLMHAAALNILTKVLVSGSSLLITDRWNPARVAELIGVTDVDQVLTIPTMFAELLDASESMPVGRVPSREVMIVGSPIAPPLLDRALRSSWPRVRSGWGMTEGGGIFTPVDAPEDAAASSLGRVGRGTEIELRSATGAAEVDEREPGEMWMRGASVCLATVDRDSGEVRVVAEHDQGWYDTGDLVTPDGAGGYRLVGRNADRIGGAFMIPVTDVENALRSHPAIDDVVIVGHRENTEGCAFVVSAEPVGLSDVRSHLRNLQMTEWYWPTRVEQIDELPRNSMGKLDKLSLRKLLVNREAD